MNNTTAIDKTTSMEAKALHESAMLARRFVALAFCRSDLLFELDTSQNVLFSAGATPPLFDKSNGQMIGLNFLDLIHDDDKNRVLHILNNAGKEGRFDDVPVRLKTLKSDESHSVFAGYRVPDFENNFFLAVKINPNQKAQPHLQRRESDRDIEARVLNKQTFASVAAERIKEVSQAGGETGLTMINIDNLEGIKKDLSQTDQSKLMTSIGSILSSQSLGGDTVGRIDDENFGFIHDKSTDVSDVGAKLAAAAQEITPGLELNATTKTIDTNDSELTEEQLAKAISYTMGNFSSGKAINDPATIASLFETMMAETMKQVAAFKKICATRAFDLVYMPICNLKTGGLHHFEALTRFRTGAESPYQLITLAEEIGVISEFDIAVAQKAVSLVNKQAAAGHNTPIAVNVSGYSIQDDNYVKELQDLLKSATNLSRMLMFEITESSEIKDLEAVNATIQSFRSKGFKFALDDFGAGAASFDYLNSFDIDTVKFDGPVVKRAYATDKGKAFLASMATLCNETGVETIAEMVEDKELADFLLGCGIHLGQGWYFGKPIPDPNKYKNHLK